MMDENFIKAIEKAFGIDNAEVYCVCSAYVCIYNWTKTNQLDGIYSAVDFLNMAIHLDQFTPISCDKNKTELLIQTQGPGLTIAHYICQCFELLNELSNKKGSEYATSLVTAHSYLLEATRLWKEYMQ